MNHEKSDLREVRIESKNFIAGGNDPGRAAWSNACCRCRWPRLLCRYGPGMPASLRYSASVLVFRSNSCRCVKYAKWATSAVPTRQFGRCKRDGILHARASSSSRPICSLIARKSVASQQMQLMEQRSYRDNSHRSNRNRYQVSVWIDRNNAQCACAAVTQFFQLCSPMHLYSIGGHSSSKPNR